MLTRLRVKGFKNLLDVDVRFGPFTCIAGGNAVGKSNLFDAITFLSALADLPLAEAARSVRDPGRQPGDLRHLSFHLGDGQYLEEMSFEAEMIVPREGVDELGQKIKAGATLLRYRVALAQSASVDADPLAPPVLVREELVPIPADEATEYLPFPHAASWRKSVVTGRRAEPLISTEGRGLERTIRLHRDAAPGRAASLSWPAFTLPRTLLSVPRFADSATFVLARQELRSWRRFQFEPAALRRPDELSAPATLGPDGAHLPATLYRLVRAARANGTNGVSTEEATGRVYSGIANRLFELVEDVRDVSLDVDEKRQLLTILVTDRRGVSLPAQALSDGTLRFLALAILAEASDAAGLLCLEEPENGIHPGRVPALLRLLQEMAADVRAGVGPDNPLRQVIVNTHSPAVVLQVPEDSLVLAELQERADVSGPFKQATFSGLAGTWRARVSGGGAALGDLLVYLNPIAAADEASSAGLWAAGLPTRRVVDRPDLQELLFPSGADG